MEKRYLFIGAGACTLLALAAPSCQIKDECRYSDCPPADATGATSTGATSSSGGATSSGGNGEGGATTGGNNGSACTTECTGGTPLCHQDSGDCVECLDADDCTGAFCNLDTHACVACLDSSHCLEANAARCEDGECTGCTSHDDCGGIAGKELCNDDTGECVECTPETEQERCGAMSCNPATFTCGPYERGSRGACRSCVSDSDCNDNHRCVPMEFPAGTPRPSGFCLQVTPGCQEPYSVTLTGRTSLSGVSGSTYCGISEELTTCEAVRALESNWRCDPNDPGDGFCWRSDQSSADAVEVPGALCRTVGDLAGFRCTYECDGTPECPTTASQSTCGSDAPEAPRYCGGPSD